MYLLYSYKLCNILNAVLCNVHMNLYIKAMCTNVLCTCIYSYCKMYIAAYMSLGVHIHTIDELTESNVGVLDDILDNFWIDLTIKINS